MRPGLPLVALVAAALAGVSSVALGVAAPGATQAGVSEGAGAKAAAASGRQCFNASTVNGFDAIDDDTVLVRVTRLGDGNVCHTGDRSCFNQTLPPAPKGRDE